MWILSLPAISHISIPGIQKAARMSSPAALLKTISYLINGLRHPPLSSYLHPPHSLQPQTADKGCTQAAQGHHHITDGQGLKPCLHIKSHTVGIYPEITVIYMAAGPCACTGCQENKDWIKAQAGRNGGTQGSCCCHGHGTRTLDYL